MDPFKMILGLLFSWQSSLGKANSVLVVEIIEKSLPPSFLAPQPSPPQTPTPPQRKIIMMIQRYLFLYNRMIRVYFTSPRWKIRYMLWWWGQARPLNNAGQGRTLVDKAEVSYPIDPPIEMHDCPMFWGMFKINNKNVLNTSSTSVKLAR